MGGSALKAKGGAKNRLGPLHFVGDARSSHTGSIRMRTPSISTIEVACPIQVMRSPERGLVAYAVASV